MNGADAQTLLKATDFPTGWRLGIFPDGEGGLEIRFYQAGARKHISVTLAEGETSVTVVSSKDVGTVWFDSGGRLQNQVRLYHEGDL